MRYATKPRALGNAKYVQIAQFCVTTDSTLRHLCYLSADLCCMSRLYT